MGEELFGPYRLLSRIGVGGMGEVWRALDTRKEREVAVKVLGAWLGGEAGYAARFRREAALAARLNAPNIIPIHDYGEINGRLFMEMPLVLGADLDALVAQSGPLEPVRAVAMIEQLATALDTAHSAGLIHRDVKPSNVLIAPRTDGDFVYLIDFGIARTADSTQITTTGQTLGTLAYMAPERFVGGGDHRGDVYALACVLHLALTGRKPFEPPAGVHELGFYVHAHMNETPPRPSDHAEDHSTILEAFDDVIAHGMAKVPDDRYPSAGALGIAARTALGVASSRQVDASSTTTPPSGEADGSVADRTDSVHMPDLDVPASHHRFRRIVTAAPLTIALAFAFLLIVAIYGTARPESPGSVVISPPVVSEPFSATP